MPVSVKDSLSALLRRVAAAISFRDEMTNLPQREPGKMSYAFHQLGDTDSDSTCQHF
jgi:hypothetical protein